MNKIRAMLLGCGELGKEVAISLKRYGIEVVGVDRYPSAPAHQVSDLVVVIDMTDPQQLKDLVELYQPDIIIPEIEAIATSVLYDMEKDGITVVPTARAVDMTMNRERIRTLVAKELDLPTSKYAFVSTEQELVNAAESITGYPCFVKPTMSSSGKGQTMVTCRDELAGAWEYAQSGGRTNTGTVIVESKINFDYEITLLTVRSMDANDNIKIDCCQPIGHRQENGDYRESWQPHPMNPLAMVKAQYIAKTVVENLGGFGVFGVELFVKGDDVWFSEVSPRPHDTGMVTMVTQHQSEFDLHVRAILGLPVDVSTHSCGASSVILSTVESDDIEYNGLCQALNIPNTEIRIFGKPTATINRRMGVALARANDVETATRHAIACSNLVDISEF